MSCLVTADFAKNVFYIPTKIDAVDYVWVFIIARKNFWGGVESHKFFGGFMLTENENWVFVLFNTQIRKFNWH